MAQLILWMKEYSFPVVLLLMVLAGLIFVIQKTIEKTIETSFDARKKETELILGRQSAFKDKILSERYTVINGLLARLIRILTDINRVHQGFEVADGSHQGPELVPLTAVFEDLQISRLVLGERYYDLFVALANSALHFANAKDTSARQRLLQRQDELLKQLRDLADNDFGISNISLREPGAG